MSGIVDWVKDYSMVFLLMTVLTSVAAKKEYRRYIQLFVEIILVITLMDPLLQAFGKSGDLFEKISYDSFWQGLNGIRMDREKMDFLEEDYYIGYYERAIEADAGLLAESFGYTVIEASVTLNEAYEVESMALAVAKSDTRQVIVGTVGRKPEKPVSPPFLFQLSSTLPFFFTDAFNAGLDSFGAWICGFCTSDGSVGFSGCLSGGATVSPAFTACSRLM